MFDKNQDTNFVWSCWWRDVKSFNFCPPTLLDQQFDPSLSKQLIQDLDGSIALNKDFVLGLREIWLFKLED